MKGEIMAIPSEKSPEITNFLETVFGRSTAIHNNKCTPAPIGCGKVITRFKDAVSAKEYQISGLCQECQDLFFGEDE